MKDSDVINIETIIQDRNDAHNYYSVNSPVYRAFMQMEKTAFVDGLISKGYKELIAIGISITINCESCLEWHIKQTLDAAVSQ